MPDHDHRAGDPRRVHLGVFFTGVGPQLIWADPSCASHHEIDTFVQVIQILERGLFDAFFLGEGLRVRENRGKVFDLDVSGRPHSTWAQRSASIWLSRPFGPPPPPTRRANTAAQRVSRTVARSKSLRRLRTGVRALPALHPLDTLKR
jgi:alkanesulfonate monooxygenase SsuD/methylene tetrahydromethanopterin reductase-like flavin-dependent oxidoreductase (luciferase family)